MQIHFFVWAAFCLSRILTPAGPPSLPYSWIEHPDSTACLAHRISVPDGFQRVEVLENSFAHWLRYLPLQAGRPAVMLYNGQPKGNQSAHHAVIDIDVGNRDLQQCADAVMRLRAEYEYAAEAYDKISFRFTSGDEAAYRRWRQGYRPRISGNSVRWVKTQSVRTDYASFREYMNTVFTYAGTYSLDRDLASRPDSSPVEAGEIFIQGGFPGHAVIIVDVAVNPQSGERIFLLAQSYMPAQQMHILRNPTDQELSPWFRQITGPLLTPEWRFPPHSRKTF